MFEQRLDAIRRELPGILDGNLSKADTSQYMVYWEAGVSDLTDQYSEVKGFFRELLTFTQGLNRQFEIDAMTRSRVRQATLDAFLTAGGRRSTTDNAAAAVAPSSPPRAATAGNNQSAQHHVFNAFLVALVSRFDSRFGRAGSLRVEFAARIVELAVEGSAASTMRRWAASEHFSGDFSRMNEQDMRRVVDLIYTLMCDEFGPVDADDIISEAAASVEQSRESRFFSVRNLL